MQPFHSELELDTNPSVQVVQYGLGAFTSDECRRIIEIGEARPKVDGRIEEQREAYRVSQIAWIEPHPDTHWLYHKLAVLFNKVNASFGFELLGLIDSPQYTVYGAGQHFDWHIDVGPGGASVRKLSITVLLTDGAEYEGGDLEFLGVIEQERPRTVGTAIIFPSFLAHRVTPVESGIRRSLVAWACGPSFR